FELPIGTILVKTFSRDGRKLETRLLIHQQDAWRGAAYIYDARGIEATLAIAGGAIGDYTIPNENQCKNCHGEHDEGTTPLGPKARHLNRGEQLQELVDRGVVVGAPPRDRWPRLADASDPTSGTLDERARAWLDINCGHCHNPRGAARTSGLYLDVLER